MTVRREVMEPRMPSITRRWRQRFERWLPSPRRRSSAAIRKAAIRSA
jgi:hypothetical protein